MPKGVYDVCLRTQCFLYTYVWYDFFHSQMEIQYDVGAWFLNKKILSDHCPFAKYEVGGRKILISMKQNRAILESLGLNINCLIKESIDSLFL